MQAESKGMRIAVAAAALCVVLGACVVFREFTHKKPSRGLTFTHEIHTAEGLECADCHDLSAPEFAMPKHELCSVCHEIPEDAPTAEACSFCHTKPDYAVLARVMVLPSETKFDHAPHELAGLACTECHADPDKAALPPGPMMPVCVDCHTQAEAKLALVDANLTQVDASLAQTNASLAQTNASLTDCAVCHTEVRIDVVPKFHGTKRLAHDSPQVWEKIHGRESQADPMFCARCHDEQESCASCHRTTKPVNHTTSWSRKTHGIMAGWDRMNCSVCHEEEMCMKCHESTQPTSHRASFAGSRNTHCVQCHFPPENNCAVCHQSIEHASAGQSPHDVGGGFTGNCAECHPGGIAGRAPHIVNAGVTCRVCHE